MINQETTHSLLTFWLLGKIIAVLVFPVIIAWIIRRRKNEKLWKEAVEACRVRESNVSKTSG